MVFKTEEDREKVRWHDPRASIVFQNTDKKCLASIRQDGMAFQAMSIYRGGNCSREMFACFV